MPSAPRAMPVERIKSSVHLSFSRKEMPDGFKDLSIGDDVMVVLRGKVKSLSQYEDEWSVSVEYGQLELVGNAKPKTMQDALDAMRGGKS